MQKEEFLLRKLRGHMAYKKNVEPYRIFRDSELVLLLQERPTTIEQLITIKGFPAEGARVAICGQAIIDIFSKTKEVDDFEVNVDNKGSLTVTTLLKPLAVF